MNIKNVNYVITLQSSTKIQRQENENPKLSLICVFKKLQHIIEYYLFKMYMKSFIVIIPTCYLSFP